MSKIQKKERFQNGNIWKAVKNNLGIILSLLVLCVALTFATEYFLTTKNILNVLLQISTNGMIAFGMTYVILLGGICSGSLGNHLHGFDGQK